MVRVDRSLLAFALVAFTVEAWSSSAHTGQSATRRSVGKAIASGFATAALAFVAPSPKVANALDMDSFINSELNSDTTNCNPKTDRKCKPEMTKDEAMCKYGQSGDARGEACKRFKESGGALAKQGSSAVKSMGGSYAN